MKVTAMDIYKLLPKTNCGKCGDASCMAFAAKLSQKEAELSACPQLKGADFEKLANMLAPAVKEIKIGTGNKAVTIGGDEVLYRYELTYYNPTAIAVDLSDDMDDSAFDQKLVKIKNLEFERTGEILKLNAVALRNKSGDSEQFKKAAEKLKDSEIPVILCSFDSKAMDAALDVLGSKRPLIYAATENNIDEMSKLALKHNCPISLFVPNDLEKMKQLSRKLRESGVKDIVLDPGTYIGEAIADTMDNFIMIRRLAVEEKDDDFRFPILAVPAVCWINPDGDEILTKMKEATTAAALMNRYADVMILHGIDIWEMMPVLTLRQSLYTDPRKPQSVESKIYEFGTVDENSPVIMTTNFALTYYTVAGDLKSGKVNCYLLVLDTNGKAVDVAVAGGQFNGKAAAELIKDTGIEKLVNHKKLIIPGLAASVSGDIEDQSGWEVIVGTRDSSEVPAFLAKIW
ncbi:acetyl-CoA decarbonylase/synthase complex subunit gamma [Methanococcus maripaludis]|uniref:Acetyl-CoA decarbonylase/synthase complex subunit gamma n=1 Tax=Methanococcus maripaludis TaxID=39152 RepID=A0A2L1C889_METMI|nr:acetyl-CoA decarbonylase/synthase complex subunit gamma [Methanococcus maripaludis]AVB75430.1 Corrinoid/iron-sulfur protein large subunit [Methanococcus maripaludis]MBB6496239.1 acetyl-CoA decarbonylase/synthase complex subunit gamma [Methanococcus maripaludis]